MKNLLKIAFAIFLCISVSYAAPQKGTMTDPRDGKKYKTVKFGDQVWMAENLNYEMSSSYCYDDNPDNCKKYGRLYKWAAAQKACPNGWHLPDDKYEFPRLFAGLICAERENEDPNCVAPPQEAWYSYDLKSIGDWNTNGCRGGTGTITPKEATDKFSFSILPAGYRSSTEEFDEMGKSAYFWTSKGYEYYNNISDLGAYAVVMYHCTNDISLSSGNGAGYHKNRAHSVRCIKD